MSTRTDCEEIAKKHDLSVCHYNPGTKGPKVRVFEGLGRDWFDSHAIFATAGNGGDWAKALIFLEGYDAAMSTIKEKQTC